MIKIKVAIFLIVFMPLLASAQKVENVDFTVRDNIVTIKYDLVNCPDNYMYDMRIKFKSDAGDYIYPKNPSGDLKSVSQGIGKEITWNVLGDNQELKGNISVIVEIEDRHYVKPRREKMAHGKIKGGPSNAFLSMLLPGLGDYFVNKYANESSSSATNQNYGRYESKNNGYWYVVPVAYYLCLYAASSEYTKYKQSYADYHSATIQAIMDQHYDEATKHYQTSQLYVGIAAAAWLCDVIHVAAKGFQNKKHQLNGYSFKEPKTKYYFVTTGRSFQFGLTHKF